MISKAARIEQFVLAVALGVIVSVRITCEWLEPRNLLPGVKRSKSGF